MTFGQPVPGARRPFIPSLRLQGFAISFISTSEFIGTRIELWSEPSFSKGESCKISSLPSSITFAISKSYAEKRIYARAQGFKRISLETGTTEHFKPARGLYKTLGYKECEAFGEYAPSEYSTFMTKMFQ